MFWTRLAAALLLAVLLRGDFSALTAGGLVFFREILFPYAWLFLVLDPVIARRRLNDKKRFVFGASFAFLYSGIYTKIMHDGLRPLGLDWGAVLFEPLKWGIFVVLWFHCLEALFPEKGNPAPESRSWRGAILGLSASALALYALRVSTGFFVIERLEAPYGYLWDGVFFFTAAGLARWAWRGEPAEVPRPTVTKLMLWAAGLKIAASLLGVVGPRWAVGISLNLPSQALFFYAFFRSPEAAA